MDRIKIRIMIATLILTGIGGYALFESRNLLAGPIIEIETPLDGSKSSSPVANIKGVAKNIVRIKMNDREISVNEAGVFNQKFVLSDGSNTVKLSAEDRFGRGSEAVVQILYEKPAEALVQRNAMSDYQ